MRRSGFGTLFMVMLAVVLLFTWAGAQHFVTGSVRRRVRLGETQRAATLQALNTAEQLTALVPALMRLSPPGATPVPGLPVGLEEVPREPGALPLQELTLKLPWMASSMKHVDVAAVSSGVRNHWIRVRTNRRVVRGLNDHGAGNELTLPDYCEAYRIFVDHQAGLGREPGEDTFVSERAKLFPTWGPMRLTGVGHFRATSRARGHGVTLEVDATIQRQVEFQCSPCPDVGDPTEFLQFQVHPVEIARTLVLRRSK